MKKKFTKTLFITLLLCTIFSIFTLNVYASVLDIAKMVVADTSIDKVETIDKLITEFSVNHEISKDEGIGFVNAEILAIHSESGISKIDKNGSLIIDQGKVKCEIKTNGLFYVNGLECTSSIVRKYQISPDEVMKKLIDSLPKLKQTEGVTTNSDGSISYITDGYVIEITKQGKMLVNGKEYSKETIYFLIHEGSSVINMAAVDLLKEPSNATSTLKPYVSSTPLGTDTANISLTKASNNSILATDCNNTLPKTGEVSNYTMQLIGILLITLGVFVFVIYKRMKKSV